MAGAIKIQLQNVRFFAAHGLYTEEAQIGNEFEVNVSITYKAPKENVVEIERTIDYVKVYQLINDVMQVQQGLLETCAMLIIEKIQLQFNFIKKATIKISKVNPPITNFKGNVGVTFTKRFK